MKQKELTRSGKVRFITFTYLEICSISPVLINKKLSKNYWAIYNFILKKPDVIPQIQKLYDYAEYLRETVSVSDKRIMSFSDFFKKAEYYRMYKIDESQKQQTKELLNSITIPKYKNFSLSDLDNL